MTTEQNKQKHIHDQLIREYAEDWAISKEPWKLWEYCCPKHMQWTTLLRHPEWDEHLLYRRKKKTVSLGGIEVPAAEVNKPCINDHYFVPISHYADAPSCFVWCDDSCDNRFLADSLVYKTEEDAIKVAKALIQLLKQVNQ